MTLEMLWKVAKWLQVRVVELTLFQRQLRVFTACSFADRNDTRSLVGAALKTANQPPVPIYTDRLGGSEAYDLIVTPEAETLPFDRVHFGGLITDGKSVWRVRPHNYDFVDAQKEWSAPPFSHIGYFSTERLLRECTDAQNMDAMEKQRHYRFDGYVNTNNEWRDALGYDKPLTGKTVMDFGCGTGIEALEFARAGADVVIADIAPSNVEFAARCFKWFGLEARLKGRVDVSGVEPFFAWPDASLDIFTAIGVLHHTPRCPDILRRVRRALKPGGQCRLIFYSEATWSARFDHDPKIDVTTEPGYFGYVRSRDSVGKYATWYNREKIENIVGDVYSVAADGICGCGEYYWCWLEARE